MTSGQNSWTHISSCFLVFALDWFFFIHFSKSLLFFSDIMLGTGGTGMNQTTLLVSWALPLMGYLDSKHITCPIGSSNKLAWEINLTASFLFNSSRPESLHPCFSNCVPQSSGSSETLLLGWNFGKWSLEIYVLISSLGDSDACSRWEPLCLCVITMAVPWYLQGIGSRTLVDAKSADAPGPVYKVVQWGLCITGSTVGWNPWMQTGCGE